MKLGRVLASAFLATALGATTFAVATSLGLSTRDLGAGSASVPTCDGDGVSATYDTSAGNVSGVTISGIAAACVNGALKVALADSSGAAIGSGGAVTVDAISEALSISPQPPAADVTQLHVVIEGP